jgi:phosphoserine aminotransferase
MSSWVQVLFVQGGASTQFAALPLNFAPEGATIDFVVTGSWGQKCVRAGLLLLQPPDLTALLAAANEPPFPRARQGR